MKPSKHCIILSLAYWRNLLPIKSVITVFLAAIAFACLPETAHAITYANTSVTFSWIDASTHAKIGYNTTPYKFNGGGGCGTAPPVLDDTLSDNIPIGFTFMYSGVNFTNVRIMSNGRLQFNDNTTCGYGSPVTQLPYPNAGLNYTQRIYGNDLDPTLKSDVTGYTYNTVCTDRAVCYVSYATIGTAPYRKFVVTWNNVPEWTGTSTASGSYNLQIILQENGEFIYQYGADTPGPGNTNAQIGWQADTNDYDIPAVGFPTNNTAIKFYIPRPVTEYRMEQTSWTTAAGQVLDTSGNSRHGTRVGNAQTTSSGKVCRGANIPQNNNTNTIDAINTGISIPNTVGNAGTITFWYQGNSAWSGGGTQDAQMLDATVADNQWFFLVRRNSGRLRFVITDSLGNNRVAETGAIAVAAGTWKHIAISWNFNALGGANQDRMRIYVDGVLQTTFAFTTNGTLSTQIGTLYAGDNRSGFTGQNGTGRSTDGVLDEFRIYNYEGGLALIQRDMNQAGVCLDHYAISHSGTGTTCQETPVTITAHSSMHAQVVMPNNTTQITLSTSTGKGDWSLLNGYGVINNGTADDGTASYLFNGEYQAIFGLSHTLPGTVNINVTDGQITESALEDPLLVLSSCSKPSGFNCVEAGADALTGHLFTKLAGTAFSFDVVALKDTNNDGTADAVETAYAADGNKSVIVELVDGSGTTACNARDPLSPAVSQTLIFTQANQPTEQGRKNAAPMTVAKAYPDIRCRVTDTSQSPTLVGCSSDNFSVRPGAATLSTTASATPPSAAALPIIKAGAAFTVTAATSTAVADTYTGTLTLDATKLTAQDPSQDTTQQSGGTVGTLSPASLITNQSPAPSNNAAYTEAGHLYLAPGAYRDDIHTSVDQPNDCVSSTTGDANLADTLSGGKYGCTVGNKTGVSFGRFIPDHFAITPGIVTEGCDSGNFTYFGQDGFSTAFTLSAQNTANATTQNYRGVFAKLDLTAWNNYNFTASGLPVAPGPISTLLASATAPSGVWLNGAAAITARHQASRPAAPVAPASITISALPADTDGVTMGSAVAVHATATPLRFGRLVVQNAYGTEAEDHRVPFLTQFLNNVGQWAINSQDRCTALTAANFGFGNYLQQLAADEMNNTHITAGLSVLTLNNGRGSLYLTRPSTGDGRYVGSVDVCVDLGPDTPSVGSPPALNTAPVCVATSANLPWLQGRWSETNYDDDPTGRINFGIYRGNDRIINWREIIR
ncbi:MAG: hypothetical protein L6300_11205 [Syntrophaceae bacterium]|nr:hypothetical protein [Syntrophaceae bacterium]